MLCSIYTKLHPYNQLQTDVDLAHKYQNEFHLSVRSVEYIVGLQDKRFRKNYVSYNFQFN